MLRDKLANEAKQALLAGDRRKAEALRFLISLLDKEATKKLLERLEEADELKVLQKELKNKEESLAAFVLAGRNDLVAEIKEEINWLAGYLPKSLSDEEIKKVIDEVLADGEKQFGAVMKKVLAKVAGRVDGAKLSLILKEKLAQ